ncbi:hypothetical protein RJ641_019970 [Dillenia turbinata]|uniref:Uncharacterized protein n=1 Tax=Dillenia turbinata TaxID=194707 RepID=A0AAN8YZ51_9MAGN
MELVFLHQLRAYDLPQTLPSFLYFLSSIAYSKLVYSDKNCGNVMTDFAINIENFHDNVTHGFPHHNHNHLMILWLQLQQHVKQTQQFIIPESVVIEGSRLDGSGAFGGSRGLKPVPPGKGIFPLDHMHLCDLGQFLVSISQCTICNLSCLWDVVVLFRPDSGHHVKINSPSPLNIDIYGKRSFIIALPSGSMTHSTWFDRIRLIMQVKI